MDSLVLELQKEASSQNVSISELLKKAYIVARKLKIKDFEEWINYELKGYTCSYEEIPKYREVSGETKAWDPYNGWIPVIINEPTIGNMLTKHRLFESTTHLEVITKSEDKQLTFRFSQEIQNDLNKLLNQKTKFAMFFDKAELFSIFESVKTIVLEWALKLEEDGILGKDMVFSTLPLNIFVV